MKKLAKAAAVALAAVIVVWVAVTAVVMSAEAGDLDDLAAQTQREYILSDDELANSQLGFMDRTAGALTYSDGMELVAETEYEFSMEVDEAGTYWIAAVYSAYEDNAFENQVSVGVNGETCTVVLPFMWADTCETGVDRYGNEI